MSERRQPASPAIHGCRAASQPPAAQGGQHVPQAGYIGESRVPGNSQAIEVAAEFAYHSCNHYADKDGLSGRVIRAADRPIGSGAAWAENCHCLAVRSGERSACDPAVFANVARGSVWDIGALAPHCLSLAGRDWHQRAKLTIAHHSISYFTSAGDTVFDADYDAAAIAVKEATGHHRIGLSIRSLRSIDDGQRLAWNRRNKHTGKAFYPRHAGTLIGRSGNTNTAALAIITAGLASPPAGSAAGPLGFDAAIGQAASLAVLDSSVIWRLAECRQALKPGGIVVVYAPRFRRHGELADVPGLAIAALRQQGFAIVDRCAVMLDESRPPAPDAASNTGRLPSENSTPVPPHQHIHDDLIVAVNR